MKHILNSACIYPTTQLASVVLD